MLTTGSKFFFAGAVLALGAMVVYGIGTEWQEYFGLVLLGSLAVVSAFLGFVVVAFRDANLGAPAIEALSAADAEGRAAVGHRGVPSSAWPIVGAFGAGMTVVGLVLDWRLFVLGLAALIAT